MAKKTDKKAEAKAEAPAKKADKKKAEKPAKKADKKAETKKADGPPKPMPKSQLFKDLAAKTELSQKKIGEVFDALTGIIKGQISDKKIGVFALPGLLKIHVVHKPATEAKKGVKNPFKPGELMDIPAKPARNVVKVRPLKGLKEMV
jgi:nucleoid DNA-binding protein